MPCLLPEYEFNLLNYLKEESTLAACRREELHYMAFSPLAGGILTGKYKLQEFPDVARWSHWRNTRGLPEYWNQKSFDSIEHLRKIAIEMGISLAGLALAWIHFHPEVRTTLTGPRNRNHLLAIEEAQKLSLTSNDFNRIAKLFS